ncbi:hypothetical protein [Tropicibacter naphthalenivorans]|uniref:Uncharacterized protein n=1 Tax=Tropicibacter naphthalenivorans TaxID=441103 RepID=A0A0P1G311_9RHOB|nr:hypothetical protein [Tropicibacter naphthalenivorans]CUH76188.1 hypothetical protein TRN7648_00825 [Tropicibacter naphthalenivorans]SMC39470.1 hypothetical protein SAMN04488093_10159 [Tropicibacter naphthalenivorans]
MFTNDKVTHDLLEIAEFLLDERAKTLSEAEWRFRMRGYGYNLRRVDEGIEVAKLPKNEVLGTIAI